MQDCWSLYPTIDTAQIQTPLKINVSGRRRQYYSRRRKNWARVGFPPLV